MSDKYYTPSLEEFRVGFEYEEKSSGLWSNQVYDEISPILNQEYCDDYGVKYDTIQDYINQQIIRVKYLDREDIESLGFKQVITDQYYIKRWSKDITLLIDSDYYMQLIIKEDGIEEYLFQGTIKNINELKVLLTQLGIEYDK